MSAHNVSKNTLPILIQTKKILYKKNYSQGAIRHEDSHHYSQGAIRDEDSDQAAIPDQEFDRFNKVNIA